MVQPLQSDSPCFQHIESFGGYESPNCTPKIKTWHCEDDIDVSVRPRKAKRLAPRGTSLLKDIKHRGTGAGAPGRRRTKP
jgi:hypothetical protein